MVRVLAEGADAVLGVRSLDPAGVGGGPSGLGDLVGSRLAAAEAVLRQCRQTEGWDERWVVAWVALERGASLREAARASGFRHPEQVKRAAARVAEVVWSALARERAVVVGVGSGRGPQQP